VIGGGKGFPDHEKGPFVEFWEQTRGKLNRRKDSDGEGGRARVQPIGKLERQTTAKRQNSP